MGTYAPDAVTRFEDKRDAGRRLAQVIEVEPGDDPLVLALPRGGVPVADEIARAIRAPLDVLVVRKLGVPGHEELAMGAIAAGVRVLNDDVVALARVGRDTLERVTRAERAELERRERTYRGDRPPPRLAGRHVIVVDDGLATGATMRAAVEALLEVGPARITVAVPVASVEAVEQMRALADDVAVVLMPRRFRSVGEHYLDFSETTDDEVRRILAAHAPAKRVGATPASSADPALAMLRAQARPLLGTERDFAPLEAMVKNARLVLIGESTHGSHDHYDERARMTSWLIERHGFTDVAVEADWPDAWRVNRFVRGEDQDGDADAALGDFERFPRWMWRNAVVQEFVTWLRVRNDALVPGDRAGFMGLDLYSLHRSMSAVVQWLEQHDPEGAAIARARYACFDQFGEEPQMYGYATERRGWDGCEREVADQLDALRAHVTRGGPSHGPFADDDRFFAEQNARLAKNAEAYYRAMYRSSVSSWNLRDSHMHETLEAMLEHLTARRGREAKIVVWAHNSHLGDARATHMGWTGEHDVGQLARQRHGDRAVLIGQTTHHGTVSAASDWGEDVETKRVRPGLPGSYEALLHEVGVPRALYVLRGGGELTQLLRAPRLERAIGVIYRPDTERQSHYFHARLSDQFDAVIHLDETRAVEPLDRVAGFAEEDAPETYPTGV